MCLTLFELKLGGIGKLISLFRDWRFRTCVWNDLLLSQLLEFDV